jgi:hypothetical protein
VLGARAAGFDQSFLQRLSRTKHAHAGIARRQTMLVRERLDRRALDVDRLQRVGVFQLQRSGQTADTRADLRFELRVGRAACLELARERL